MGLYLSVTECRRIVAAQHAMLAPLVHENLASWMLSVNDALREVTGADHIMAFISEPAGFAIFSNDTDTEPLDLVQGAFAGYDDAGFALLDDASIKYAHRVRRQGGTGAYHERQFGDVAALKQGDLFQASFEPARARYMMGLSTPLPQGEATICTAFERPGAKDFSIEGLQKLQLLAPAFEAGVQMWQRLVGYQNLLDNAGPPLAVYGPEGEVLFRSRMLAWLLDSDSKASAVLRAMQQLARRLCTRQPRRARKARPEGQVPPACTVQTGRGVYRICGSPLPSALFGTRAVLVTAERQEPVLPPSKQLRARFGLTPREAEVARLLAEGLSNSAVAETLFISPHTARRHTEKVLHKLGVSSRSAVALTLLRPA